MFQPPVPVFDVRGGVFNQMTIEFVEVPQYTGCQLGIFFGERTWDPNLVPETGCDHTKKLVPEDDHTSLITVDSVIFLRHNIP
jgi:hypothetical protein